MAEGGAGEFELIRRIAARVRPRGDVPLGIGDDAALLAPPAGHELVVTTDALVGGVHFPEHTAPADLGWKALAVNLSDLAAMGADAAWATLALTLPRSDPDWLDGFLDGFLELADTHAVALVGGDLARGPLNVAVTAIGSVPAGAALRRAGARVGDDVYVTGTLGDAAAALAQWRDRGHADAPLWQRLNRPLPRLQAARALRALAAACIDVSDGLAADLGHIVAASGVGAEIELARLPCSAALAAAFAAEARWPLQLGGGDDYELCFCAAPDDADAVAAALAGSGVAATRIGRIVAGSGVRALRPDGSELALRRGGYAHFGEEQG